MGYFFKIRIAARNSLVILTAIVFVASPVKLRTFVLDALQVDEKYQFRLRLRVVKGLGFCQMARDCG
jgi:hypothetical protein